jgi:formate dehydrogenase alpha subunit
MTLTIDGRAIAFEGQPTILELARANGIDIPSLCDHPLLEPYAACRLCLVEVKGRRGYVPACSTTAENGLEVRTATPELAVLRRGILELILAEHPNACLICAEKSSCDEYKSTIRKTGEVTGCVLCLANGRCELQRVVEAVGVERVPFPSARREGEVRRDDPFIDRDNSLCILCGRCVRVCHEVRGATVLTFVARGSETVVDTAMGRRLVESGCRFCGACVDVCPTGSLADRAVRYERQPDLENAALCTLCGQGCRLRIGLREGRLLAAAPDPDGAANGGQACVKGRFLVRSVVDHPRRLRRPMVRKDGRLEETSWEKALDAAAARLAEIPAGKAAMALSAQASSEDLFALGRFAAEILGDAAIAAPWNGSAAAELREVGRAAKGSIPLNFRLSELGQAGAIVVLGEDLPLTQPIAGVEVNRAGRNGAVIVGVGIAGVPPAAGASIRVDLPAGEETRFLTALSALVAERRGAASIKGTGSVKFKAELKAFDTKGALAVLKMPGEKLASIADALAGPGPVFLLFGPAFLRAAGGRSGLAALSNLAVLTGGRAVALDGEANVRGGLEIGASFPVKLSSTEDLATSAAKRETRALYIAGPFPRIEPGAAELVIYQGSYDDDNARAADIVFPETTSFEAEGTFVNVEGRAQISREAVEPRGEARPGWMILSELAAKMGRTGFAYSSAADVRKDIAIEVPSLAGLATDAFPAEGLFVVEEPAAAGYIGVEGAAKPGAGKPAAPRDADDYKGLNLALETKSLRLVRGR